MPDPGRNAPRPVLSLPLDAALYARWVRPLYCYVEEIGHFPHIAFPRTYNEKMFWRRVFDRNPAFVTHCDKLATKALFAAHGIATPQTLWTGTDPDALPQALRRPGVIVKPNAGSGFRWRFGVEGVDAERFAAEMWPRLARAHMEWSGEWGYSQAPRSLLAEAMIAPDDAPVHDMKVHIFGGEVFYTLIYVGEKTPGSLSAIFDAQGRRLPVTNSVVQKDPSRALPEDYTVPPVYGAAMAAARDICADMDYMRIDFMWAGGDLYGSELAPYPTAGLMTNSSPQVMAEMGRAWDLRKAWFVRTRQAGWRERYRQALADWLEAGG